MPNRHSKHIMRRFTSPLAALSLSLSLTPKSSLASAQDDTKPSSTPTPTTAPIFLPYYDQNWWSAVRGSILSSDASASETTYTIFCPVQTPQACGMSLDFPFVVVEGPGTVAFHGTKTSTITVDLACKLDGHTKATCSGYSSYRSGYDNDFNSGPTETSWSSTLSGSAVQWGVLTLVPTPTETPDSLQLTAPVPGAPIATSGSKSELPKATDEGLGSSVRANTWWTLMAVLASIVLAAGMA